MRSLREAREFEVRPGRRLWSATHEEVLNGTTTDVYFLKTYDLLKYMGLLDTQVAAEIFASRPGVCCGTRECVGLLEHTGCEVWGLDEGEEFEAREPVMQIRGRYSDFGLHETGLLGILATSSAWATRARECREAAGDKPLICFGARHVHPAVAPVMERAAVVGGTTGASCVLGAKLAGLQPTGTIPHAAILIAGDTVKAALAYDECMPESSPRIILVDTFKDEAEETLRVAGALGEHLEGVRLDTPAERGGVTGALVEEVRARLDRAGHHHVKVFVSGGLNPERVRELSLAGADAFGVGSYISGARPIDMTLDLKEIAGNPIAKRGRVPGLSPAPRLRKLIEGRRLNA